MPTWFQPMLMVFLHTVAIYLFLILMLRFVSRRPLGQLNVIDLVVIVVLGSAVETAMVNGDTSLRAGLVCAGTLFLLNHSIGRLLLRSPKLRRLIIGNPVLLVHNGQFVEAHLRRVGMTHNEVLEAIRERDTAGIEQVKFAVLEVDGTINVVPMSAKTHRSRPPVPPDSPPQPS
jgi:uncharacterized membrane protein YcaP (DUF421 family)